MTAGPDRIGSVRIDRLVLRNVDLGPHAARVLPELIAAELIRGQRSTEPAGPIAPTMPALAAEIARHVVRHDEAAER